MINAILDLGLVEAADRIRKFSTQLLAIAKFHLFRLQFERLHLGASNLLRVFRSPMKSNPSMPRMSD